MSKAAIGVVGLGTMGVGIVQTFAQAGHPVIATDSFAPAANSALPRIANALDARIAAGKMSKDERERVLSQISFAPDLAALAPARAVIEAIAEDLDAKKALFARLQHAVSQDCILATNTSSLSVTAIMGELDLKGRGLGLHFFNPVPAMKLVELVLPEAVDTAASALATELMVGIGKTVISCADTPGFIVNRCARPFYGEALALFEEGRTPSDIDAAMLHHGYKLGPFSLIDLIGADINLAATESLYNAMARSPRYHVFEALKAQVASGGLGRKSGRGFLFPDRPGTAPPDADGIALRIEAVMANEAASLCSDTGIAPADIDTALKLGLNVPRGPFEAVNRLGLARIIKKLEALESAAPGWLKGRYRIHPVLEAMI